MSKIALVVGLEETGKSKILGVFKDKEVAKPQLTKTFKEDKAKYADVFVVEGMKNKGYEKEMYVPDTLSEFENTVEMLEVVRGVQGNSYAVKAAGITAARAYLDGLLDSVKALGKTVVKVEDDGTVVAKIVQETGTPLDVVKLDTQMGKELLKARKKALQQDLGAMIEEDEAEEEVEEGIEEDIEEDIEEVEEEVVEEDIEEDIEEEVVEEEDIEEEVVVEDEEDIEEEEEVEEDLDIEEEIVVEEDIEEEEVEEEIIEEDEEDEDDDEDIEIDTETLEDMIDEL